MAAPMAKKNQSVRKVLDIIELLAEEGRPMRLHDLAASLRRPTSTVLRFVSTLVDAGYVVQEKETLRYRLSMKLCRIGNLVAAGASFREVVRPLLERLTREFRESTSVPVEQDLNVVYVDVVDGPDRMLQTLQRIGKTAPMHATGVGNVLSADFDQGRIEDFLERRGLPTMTNHTIGTPERLAKELELVRRHGYAMDDEECEPGVRCVATRFATIAGP